MTTNKPEVVGYISRRDLEHVECRLGPVCIAADSYPGSVALIRLSDYEALQAECESLRRDAERYRWLCDKFGITRLPCAIERILSGEAYVADGKEGIDAAIDAAMTKEAAK